MGIRKYGIYTRSGDEVPPYTPVFKQSVLRNHRVTWRTWIEKVMTCS